MVVWYHPLVWIIAIIVSLVLLYISYLILKWIVLGIISLLRRIWRSIIPESANASKQSKTTSAEQSGEINSEELKYPNDPDAQQAHEEAQNRDIEDTLPKGREYNAVVLEKSKNAQRTEVRVNLFGVNVFVDENVPDSVTEGEKIRVQVTHYSSKKNAAHARFVSF